MWGTTSRDCLEAPAVAHGPRGDASGLEDHQADDHVNDQLHLDVGRLDGPRQTHGRMATRVTEASVAAGAFPRYASTRPVSPTWMIAGATASRAARAAASDAASVTIAVIASRPRTRYGDTAPIFSALART